MMIKSAFLYLANVVVKILLFTSNTLHNSRIIQAKRSFVKRGDWLTGISQNYATVCPHPSVSLDNEKKMS